MADPVTAGIAIGGMVLTAVGSMTQAAGAAYEGESKARMLEYQKGVALTNQNIALQNADYERAVGEVAAQEHGMKTRYEVGEARAIQGASNLDVNVGSAADVRESMQTVGYQDQAMIRANAARRAYGAEIEAFSKGTDAQLYGMGADTARTASKFNVASSLLGGASSVASKWLQYKQSFGSSDSTQGYAPPGTNFGGVSSGSWINPDTA